MTSLVGKQIKELRTLLLQREVSAVEILNQHLAHIERHEPALQAFNCLTPELARAQAAAVDQLIASGQPLPPLAGIPVAIKDNICVPGTKTTCSSKILADFKPSYAATVIEKLFAAGAVCLGKTNMDEFAMGSSTENSAFKRTVNPWNSEFVPGGSSGGSAAAVAAGFSVIALGSDTGGSIRQPAACCGCVGMKPTYGLVSRFGLVAYASSLDQIGPLARSVEDVATVLSVIAGHDRRDSTSLPATLPSSGSDRSGALSHGAPTGFTRDGALPGFDFGQGLSSRSPEELVKNLKIGVIRELVGEGISPDVREATLSAADRYKSLGAEVVEVSIPHAKYALPVYYLVATAEASANLARFDGVRYGFRAQQSDDVLSMYMNTRELGFGAEVKRRIILGTYALSSGYYDAYYKKAQQVRRLIKNDFDSIFRQIDLVLCPTTPSGAFRFDEKTDDPLSMYLSDIATIPANLAGLPGISLPGGFSQDGLPIGVQILGDSLSDGMVLQAAAALEKATDFAKHASPILRSATNSGSVC